MNPKTNQTAKSRKCIFGIKPEIDLVNASRYKYLKNVRGGVVNPYTLPHAETRMVKGFSTIPSPKNVIFCLDGMV
jgi:hypothetical protein